MIRDDQPLPDWMTTLCRVVLALFVVATALLFLAGVAVQMAVSA